MNKIKNTSKLIIGFILGAIIFGGLTGMLAYAINASDISFTPNDNSWEVENVKAALDDLYRVADDYNNGGITLHSKILSDNPLREERTTFGVELSGVDTTGKLYYTNNTDDESTVYYYAGAITNNWVRFGRNGDTCYYWRIIRTNTESEGGGVRLLYSGESTNCSGSVPVITNAYINNTTYTYAVSTGAGNNSSYVGYMYTLGEQHGHSTSSYVKQVLDEWYSINLNSYTSYINGNAIYCNDRSVTNQTWSATGDVFTYDPGIRIGKYYDSNGQGNVQEHTISPVSPILSCTNNEDKFSKGTSGGGNGYLEYPIALMTVDEMRFAGGALYTTTNSYIYLSSDNSSKAIGDNLWWTMSPTLWTGSSAGVFQGNAIDMNIFIYDTYDGRQRVIRPVVSLKKSVLWKSGNGSAASPYVIEES